MASPADAALAERDPAVPGLRVVLDEDALCERARRSLPGVELTGGEATYVRYKPGTSCLVAYRLRRASGEIVLATATAYRPGDGKLAKIQRRAMACGVLGRSVAVLADDWVAVQLFPYDPKLRALGCPGLVERLLPHRPDLWAVTPETLRYKPERRWVGRVGRRAVVRCYTTTEFAAARTGWTVFTSTAEVRVPALLGVCEADCALAVEWLPGGPLERRLDGAEAAGVALAALHCQEGAGLPERTPGDEAAAVFAAARAVAAVLPAAGDRAIRLAARVAAAVLAPSRPAPRATHGDFSADQVVLGEDAVGIIDLDAAALGDPAADLGHFVAALEADGWSDGQVSAAREGLLAGYRASGLDVPAERVRVQTAAGLLRRASDPFRYRNPDWPSRIEAILRRTAEVLAA